MSSATTLLLTSSVRRRAQRTRILVACADDATRQRIRAALEAAGFVVCAECLDVPSAVATSARAGADICLVHARLPGGSIAAVRAIASQPDAGSIVVLTPVEQGPELLAAVRAGASGYLSEEIAPELLAVEIAVAARGGAVLSPELAARLIEEFRRLSADTPAAARPPTTKGR